MSRINVTVTEASNNTIVVDGNNVSVSVQDGTNVNLQVTPRPTQVIKIDRNVSSGGGGGSGTVTQVTANAPLSVTNSTTTPDLSIAQATTSTAGYLSSTDWNTFNNKVSSIASADGSITVTGTTAADLAVANSPNVVVQVRNNTGSTLTKGTVVYINGAIGQLPTVTKAQANSDAASAQTLGLMTTDLANNANGLVTIIGLITNVNTSAYTDGQQLYLSPTVAGGLTATKPVAPLHMVYVAIVEHSHITQGKLFVKVQNGYELNELHDVLITSPATGQALIYDAATSLWKNTSVSGTGNINGSGSTNTIALFTGATAIGNSNISKSGNKIVISDVGSLNPAGIGLNPSQTGTNPTSIGIDDTASGYFSWYVNPNTGGGGYGAAYVSSGGYHNFNGRIESYIPNQTQYNLVLRNTTANASTSFWVDDVGTFKVLSDQSTYISSATSTGIESTAGNLTLSAYGATSDVNIYADNAITVGANANNIVATTDAATGYVFVINGNVVGGVGNNNVALGVSNFGAWLGYITTQVNNIGIGSAANYSLYNLGSNNIAIGTSAMYDGSTGTKNIALGFEAYKGDGNGNQTGSNNICIGNGAGSLLSSQSNSVFIGALTNGSGVDGDVYIGDGSGKLRFQYSGSANRIGLWTGSTTTERLRIDSSGNILNISTGGLGYGTGSGGAVTQTVSRTSGVTLNKTNGAITLVSAAGSTTWNTFTVTNSTVAATDVIKVVQKSGTDLYQIFVTNVAAGSFKISFATTGGTTTEQPVFNFAVIKAVTA